MQSQATAPLNRRRARRRFTRAAATSAALLAALVVPQLGMSAQAHAATPAPEGEEELPPGVIMLLEGETCPENILCLWRDHERTGPGYGISEGYPVYLADLPCGDDCVGGPTMDNNVSSWWNRSRHLVKLIDFEPHTVRRLKPGASLEEERGATDNTVDRVEWIRLRK